MLPGMSLAVICWGEGEDKRPTVMIVGADFDTTIARFRDPNIWSDSQRDLIATLEEYVRILSVRRLLCNTQKSYLRPAYVYLSLGVSRFGRLAA